MNMTQWQAVEALKTFTHPQNAQIVRIITTHWANIKSTRFIFYQNTWIR